MIVCAHCNQAMRPKQNGVSFVEMAADRPYKLWMADLLECQGCGAQVLYTDPSQHRIAESFEPSFAEKVKKYAPKYQAKEWTR